LDRELAAKQRELESLKNDLEDARTSAKKVDAATKVLIARITDQKKEIQELIAQNMGLTVFPLLEHMRSTPVSDAMRHLIDTLEFNLHHIASRFGIDLSDTRFRLSPREIQICRMIRRGKGSQEIADAFGLARQTVIVHRKNIRKKLGLKKVKQNLASFIREHM
jgi:DNA-binding CsgD family transcriptional regulator